MGLVKAKFIIHKEKSKETLDVLFNPAEYQLTSHVNYTDQTVPGLNSSVVQFIAGQSDQLSMTLHLDTYSKNRIYNPLVPLPADKPEDVRAIVNKFLVMLDVDGSLHAPPISQFVWGTLSFRGVVESLSHTYTMFLEDGTPVRARLEVQMRAVTQTGMDLRSAPRESPDRTKQRMLVGNTQLWAMAAQEYGDPTQWREIARANGIENPRKLPAGHPLKVPALD